MSLELDDKEWEINEYDLCNYYSHRELDLRIEYYHYTNFKYYVKVEYINQNLYVCHDLSPDDIDYIVRHYSRMLEIYEVLPPSLNGIFWCKRCNQASSEYIYTHFRTHHDSVTKSADKT